jgi:hypothetical protein
MRTDMPMESRTVVTNPVLLWGSVSWSLGKAEQWRKITLLGVKRRDHVQNDNIKQKPGEDSVVHSQKWEGHMLWLCMDFRPDHQRKLSLENKEFFKNLGEDRRRANKFVYRMII